MIFRPNLPGRSQPLTGIPTTHEVLQTPMQGPWPDGHEVLYIGMGCFWGTERIFWKLPGVYSTAVGYMGGTTENPTYDEVCTGHTAHAEAAMVVYDRSATDPEQLLAAFWENHDPTTLNRQGNDLGPQYRSVIFWTTEEQHQVALATREAFGKVLHEAGHGDIVTEIVSAQEHGPFYYAEAEHQQYLHKNPGGYCNHGPNGYSCPVGVLRQDQLPSQQSVLDQDSSAG